MNNNSSKDIVGSYSKKLMGKKVVLCITGSVAAYKSIDLARLLMRHGAEVYPVMSLSSTKMINPDLIKWATGNDAVVELTGSTEHIALTDMADIILVAPATANTINKVASGISDTTVTTLVNSALGYGKQIVMVPAMHEHLYLNPITQENIRRLKKHKISFIGPKIVEDKAKIEDINIIVDEVIRLVGEPKDMVDKKILVLGGPTIEHIDPVRIITNKSSGRMAVTLALEGYYRGGYVKLIYGPGYVKPPSYIETINVETTKEMYDATMKEIGEEEYDIVIIAAAPSDFKPDKVISRKIHTDEMKPLDISLKPTVKIADDIKKYASNTFLVLFKAEYNVSDDVLIENAYKKILRSKADIIIANDVGRRGVGFREYTNEVYVIDKEKNVSHIPLSPKERIAEEIYNIIFEKTK